MYGRKAVFAAIAALCGAISGCATLPPPRPFWQGPYQDVALGLSASKAVFSSPPWLSTPRGSSDVLIWAFATGECGQERWGNNIDSDAFARANVAAMERAGRNFIVATGGEAGIFTCADPLAAERFVQRYASPRLVGFDFDIEGRQSPEQIDALVRSAAHIQQQWPALHLMFTLATHAATDGTERSLNATGERVLQALHKHGLAKTAIINLMVMNYGPPDSKWCAVATSGTSPRCDMGRSALQAVNNVHRKYDVPLGRIAITAMLGENDVVGNVTTVEDAEHMFDGARRLGLAGVHYWSLDRDQPCAAGAPRVSPQCHSVPGVPVGRFGDVLRAPQ